MLELDLGFAGDLFIYWIREEQVQFFCYYEKKIMKVKKKKKMDIIKLDLRFVFYFFSFLV